MSGSKPTAEKQLNTCLGINRFEQLDAREVLQISESGFYRSGVDARKLTGMTAFPSEGS
jgi:hypothetical protein